MAYGVGPVLGVGPCAVLLLLLLESGSSVDEFVLTFGLGVEAGADVEEAAAVGAGEGSRVRRVVGRLDADSWIICEGFGIQ